MRFHDLDMMDKMGTQTACTECGNMHGSGQLFPDPVIGGDDKLCGDCLERRKVEYQMQEDEKERDDVFATGLSYLPTDLVLTLQLLAATYYEGLSDKRDSDNVVWWANMASDALKKQNDKAKALKALKDAAMELGMSIERNLVKP